MWIMCEFGRYSSGDSVKQQQHQEDIMQNQVVVHERVSAGISRPVHQPTPDAAIDSRRSKSKSDRKSKKSSSSSRRRSTSSSSACSDASRKRRKKHKRHHHRDDEVPPLPSPRVNPIFLWVKQDDTRIVEVHCADYDRRNRIRLTKTAQGWRAIPRTERLLSTSTTPLYTTSTTPRQTKDNTQPSPSQNNNNNELAKCGADVDVVAKTNNDCDRTDNASPHRVDDDNNDVNVVDNDDEDGDDDDDDEEDNIALVKLRNRETTLASNKPPCHSSSPSAPVQRLQSESSPSPSPINHQSPKRPAKTSAAGDPLDVYTFVATPPKTDDLPIEIEDDDSIEEIIDVDKEDNVDGNVDSGVDVKDTDVDVDLNNDSNEDNNIDVNVNNNAENIGAKIDAELDDKVDVDVNDNKSQQSPPAHVVINEEIRVNPVTSDVKDNVEVLKEPSSDCDPENSQKAQQEASTAKDLFVSESACDEDKNETCKNLDAERSEDFVATATDNKFGVGKYSKEEQLAVEECLKAATKMQESVDEDDDDETSAEEETLKIERIIEELEDMDVEELSGQKHNLDVDSHKGDSFFSSFEQEMKDFVVRGLGEHHKENNDLHTNNTFTPHSNNTENNINIEEFNQDLSTHEAGELVMNVDEIQPSVAELDEKLSDQVIPNNEELCNDTKSNHINNQVGDGKNNDKAVEENSVKLKFSDVKDLEDHLFEDMIEEVIEEEEEVTSKRQKIEDYVPSSLPDENQDLDETFDDENSEEDSDKEINSVSADEGPINLVISNKKKRR